MSPDEKKRTQLIQKAAKAVVSISVAGSPQKNGYGRASMKPSFLDRLSQKAIDVTEGGGSGFLVHLSGIIVTNTHVMPRDAGAYTAATSDGRAF